jgi:hypothetical protein
MYVPGGTTCCLRWLVCCVYANCYACRLMPYFVCPTLFTAICYYLLLTDSVAICDCREHCCA